MAAAERRLGIHELDVEEFCDSIDKLSGKQKFTRQEMDGMRETLALLYQKYVTDVQEQEAKDNAVFNEAARVKALMTEAPVTTGKQMTRQLWHEEHGLRPNGKREPDPSKKPAKKVYEVDPAKYGMASSRDEVPVVDLEAMEAEAYNQMMERLIEEQKFKLGKRFRSAADEQARPVKRQNFWN